MLGNQPEQVVREMIGDFEIKSQFPLYKVQRDATLVYTKAMINVGLTLEKTLTTLNRDKTASSQCQLALEKLKLWLLE